MKKDIPQINLRDKKLVRRVFNFDHQLSFFGALSLCFLKLLTGNSYVSGKPEFEIWFSCRKHLLTLLIHHSVDLAFMLLVYPS